MDPLSSSTTSSVTSAGGDKVLKPFVEEGKRPSLWQINRWFKEHTTINIIQERSFCGKRQVTPLSGRISEIGPYRSEKEEDTLIWIRGYQRGVCVREITSYRVETIKEVVRPLLLDPLSKKDPQIPTVTLLSEGERFVVDQERLKETVPLFRRMLESGMKESELAEIDTSSFCSTAQLKQIIMYIEDQLVVDKSKLLDPLSKKDPQIPTVTLLSHGERFVFDQERLKETFPIFRLMLEIGMKESELVEIDTSSFFSTAQLKQIIMYIEDQLVVDKSNVVDSFVLFDFLEMEELNKAARSFLIQNITQDDIEVLKAANFHPKLENFLKNICHEIIQFYRNQDPNPVSETIKSLLNKEDVLKDCTILSLECRKISYEGICHSVPYLLGNGVKNILRIFKILGGKVESLNIFNANDSDLPAIVECIQGNSQIKSLNISWNNIGTAWDGLTDVGAFLLADCINSLTSLKNLTINNHRMGDKGLKKIASALTETTSIENLNLNFNRFSSKEFDFLLEELLKNKSVEVLKLTATGFGSELKRDGGYVQGVLIKNTLQFNLKYS